MSGLAEWLHWGSAGITTLAVLALGGLMAVRARVQCGPDPDPIAATLIALVLLVSTNLLLLKAHGGSS